MPSITINLSPFEAHFGHKANTPLSNISTELNQNNLRYEPILEKYIDPATVSWDELIPEDRWEDGNRSYVDLESQRNTLSQSARNRCNDNFNKEKPRKKRKTGARRKDWMGSEFLAPGSSVIKTDEYASMIKEPGK